MQPPQSPEFIPLPCMCLIQTDRSKPTETMGEGQAAENKAAGVVVEPCDALYLGRGASYLFVRGTGSPCTGCLFRA